MLFNSLPFFLLLFVVFFLYWIVLNKKTKAQNLLIVIASYLFYGWWDWRFLILIMLSTVVDYFIGIEIHKTNLLKKRKALLLTSIVVNIGFLVFFKYCNFFIESFITVFDFFSVKTSFNTLSIILPVGISFYTFQTLSYNIDVYRKNLEPTKDFVAFTAFVSFFPQLVAGPIERATHLLPQFYHKRKFNYNQAISGIQLIIWGFFKKIVIADNASIIVDGIFNQYETQTTTSLIIGAILFAFQIYGDFSGYSDIAIGLARLFNFDLMTNFSFPYLSKNISEFWKRWHISLSTWFRDYVYIPLGGSRNGKLVALKNILIVFMISGFWHGANWTFVLWGTLHGLLYIPIFLNQHKQKQEYTISKLSKTIITFALVTLGWILFRAKNITQAFNYIALLFDNNNQNNFYLNSNKHLIISVISFAAIILLLVTEIVFYRNQKKEVLLKTPMLFLVVMIIAFFGAFKNHANFIYFQF